MSKFHYVNILTGGEAIVYDYLFLLQLVFNTPKLCFDNDTQFGIQNCRSRSEKICSNTPELAPIG